MGTCARRIFYHYFLLKGHVINVGNKQDVQLKPVKKIRVKVSHTSGSWEYCSEGGIVPSLLYVVN